MREHTLRNWNWIPHRRADLLDYLDALSLTVFDCTVEYLPLRTQISILTTEERFVTRLEGYFREASVFRFSRVTSSPVSASLVYLPDVPSIYHTAINTSGRRLLGEYQRTDVAIDPLNNFALMHGPAKIGFVKSLVLGLISYSLAMTGVHGLHSALVATREGCHAFFGSHGSGKSTMALLAALTQPSAILLSDDWLLGELDARQLKARPLETRAYLDPLTVRRILEALPRERVVNDDLYRRLQNFIEVSEGPLAESILGKDRRAALRLDGAGLTEAVRPLTHLVALRCIAEVDGLRESGEPEFVQLLMDCSYHIPFHSAASRKTLKELSARTDLDAETRALVELAATRERIEHDFWRDAIRGRRTLVFNTSHENLSAQCTLFGRLLNWKS